VGHEFHMKMAIKFFKMAIQKDPEYLPAAINLSSTMIINDQYEDSIQYSEEILKNSQNNKDAINNQAIALYLKNPEANRQGSIDLLRRIGSKSTTYPYTYSKYNIARINSETELCKAGDTETEQCQLIAQKNWNAFLVADQSGPYVDRIKNEIGSETPMRNGYLGESKRRALVVGNGGYSKNALPNAVADAVAIKRSLENLGFNVDIGINLNREKMIQLIESFGNKLTPDSVGLFYYSGHGAQIQGKNYLIPLGIQYPENPESIDKIQLFDQLKGVTVNADLVFKELSKARNLQNIVILDACRNNPLPGTGIISTGLAEIEAPPGTYVAYATSPGNLAWDGFVGENSVFTKVLLENIYEPGIDIAELFQQVRKGVKAETNDNQITWDTSTLEEGFNFNPELEQDWTWHITAGTLALITGWQAREEAKKYKALYDDNKSIRNDYAKANSSESINSMSAEYESNSEAMKTHKRNYQTLDILTLSALLWETYLLFFETKVLGTYEKPDNNLLPDTTLTPPLQNKSATLSLSWNW